MAKYKMNMNEIDIERLLKYTPEVVYEAWTKTDILKMVYDHSTHE